MLLYIHIPFCDSKCFYCAFNSYTNKNSQKEAYMRALKIDLEQNLNYLKDKEIKLNTVFIGGGTPSTVDASLYEDIFKLINPHILENCEITTEANPNSATKEWLEKMYSFGVNRVSFGVQSFDDEKLKFLGRNHNRLNAIKAIQNAKYIGFNSINCDIIYGVTNDTFELLKRDFDTLKELEVEHLSAYSLIIEEDTKFFLNEKELQKSKKSLKIDDEDLSYEIFKYLKNIGFNQYEIANFSTNEKFESKHNYGYWSKDDYIGVGAGAVACIENRRMYKQKNIEKYIQNPVYEDIEELSSDDIKAEKVLLGFRCKFGVDLNILSSKELKKVDDLVVENRVCIKENRVYNNNFLLADEIALYILD
ncbi:radical SAM family heme chaperone HemW [Aliarcobacter cryaerophilus]|uniref:radical SAM family heme chaperone HemW n=1 Tax=Aliarcobacter cryaerophilus TaxID=28198 RepID=UPI0021B2217F|nr:radical SAM family heme chaperone HemW [Aliarcobacter cryaerophilus]MCT7482988.1 radical SAM family heme chaperone HemW [Aliarcobacter cryaerophilus]MCT7533102.1 radical SAM family heme chaperone HemW [Aliarcobacter cryaerophilus]